MPLLSPYIMVNLFVLIFYKINIQPIAAIAESKACLYQSMLIEDPKPPFTDNNDTFAHTPVKKQKGKPSRLAFPHSVQCCFTIYKPKILLFHHRMYK